MKVHDPAVWQCARGGEGWRTRRIAEQGTMADEPNKEEAQDANPADGQDEDRENSDAQDGEGKQTLRKSTLRLNPIKLTAVAATLLLLLGSGTYFFWGGLPSFDTAEETRRQAKVYYNLPEMVVNLSSQDKRAQYLKLKVSLEASNQKVLDALNPIMPRVLDMFQLYLRELRSSDLEGSAGIYRLKEELLRRINLEIHPHQITRVLFNEIIVQ